MSSTPDLCAELTHVYWMGGSPCSGKSSIADALVETYGFTLYRCDEAFYRHLKIITPEAQPVYHRVMNLSSEDLWMRPVSQQVAEEIEIYREEFPMILADLLDMPKTRPILAEGAALLPELVAPLLADPRHAMWVVPTAEFQMLHYSRREWIKDVVKDCSDPQQAFRNWMQRDIRFASLVRQDARQRGLHVLVVDGETSIAENIALIEDHFQPERNFYE